MLHLRTCLPGRALVTGVRTPSPTRRRLMSKLLSLWLLSSAALATLTTATLAAPAAGLIGATTLVMFDTESLEVSGTVEVTGVDGVAGIDVRPADKMLYGVSLAGEV